MNDNNITIRVLVENVEQFKRDFPNLVQIWGLTDEECVQLCAADQMCMTVGSKPADWIVEPRNDNDVATQSWRATLPVEKHYPVRFVDPKKRVNPRA
jgi:hypothetical protein